MSYPNKPLSTQVPKLCSDCNPAFQNYCALQKGNTLVLVAKMIKHVNQRLFLPLEFFSQVHHCRRAANAASAASLFAVCPSWAFPP
jgi:hypothetical protein